MIKLTTNHGIIVLDLYATKAPKTAANFERYVKSGFYNGTIFHRVINGVMIQGGGLTADGKQKMTDAPIKNEANNGVRNSRFTVAMAHGSDPDSATSQFFINVANNDMFDFKEATPQGWGHAVFGRVVQGYDVVDAINAVGTGSIGPYQYMPTTVVRIESAEVI